MSNHKYTIHTVKHALQILKLFTKKKDNWTLTEIARHLNLNISTVQRLTKTLEHHDYLSRDPVTKRYRLGRMIVHLAQIITSTMEIHREAKPVLEELATRLDQAIHLGVLEGTEIVYLNLIQSPRPVYLNSHIGKRNPSYCTACGKVMLAYQKEINQLRLVQKLEQEGFISYGRRTVSSAEQLLNQLDQIKKQGYAVCIDEFYEGFSIGAPVYDFTEEVIAAISVTGRMNNISEADLNRYVKEVIKASEQVSRKLGYFK